MIYNISGSSSTVISEKLDKSVKNLTKGLGIGSTSKCLWNWEVVGVQIMPKVSEVGVGKTPRQLQSIKQVIP